MYIFKMFITSILIKLRWRLNYDLEDFKINTMTHLWILWHIEQEKIFIGDITFKITSSNCYEPILYPTSVSL